MSGGQRRNPVLGSVSYRLRDGKGRFTGDIRKARSYSLILPGKNDSRSKPIKPDAKTAQEKLSQIALDAFRTLKNKDRKRQADRDRAEKEKGPSAKKPRYKKTGTDSADFLEALKRKHKKVHEKVTGEIKKSGQRPGLKPIKRPKSAAKEIKAVDDGVLKARTYKLAGYIDSQMQSIYPDFRDIDDLVQSFGLASLSTKGRKTETHQVAIPGRPGKKMWVPVSGDEGNPFVIAEEEGIRPEEHLWTIVREYLRELGYGYFLRLGQRLGKSGIMLLGAVVSTNVAANPDYQAGTPRSIRFNMTARNSEERKKAMDTMTYQTVRALVQAINQTEGATQSEYSLLSSGKSLVRPLSSPGPRGQKSTKEKTIKIAFTLFVD